MQLYPYIIKTTTPKPVLKYQVLVW